MSGSAGGGAVTAEPSVAEAPLPAAGREHRALTALAFLAPAIVFLGVWVLYPMVYTVIRSFFGRTGFGEFVGIDNYKALFQNDVILKSIENSAIWVAIVPATITALGLIFAVLTERVRWSVAFKTILFMPMAISLFATGVIWHVMYLKDPHQGAVNAAIGGVRSAFTSGGPIADAQASTPTVIGSKSSGFTLKTPVRPGQVARIGLTGIPPDDMPATATQAVDPKPASSGIAGVVWRDFSPGGGKPGKVENQELGIPGATVDLKDSSGKTVQKATTGDNGDFSFSGVSGGAYTVSVDKSTFSSAFGGVSWLGSQLITPSIIVAYIWVWAGFAMVVIGAGLAAMPRDVLEAARTDGATEWQVFRRVTVPLLAPVLSVVFITMLINVLKVFDIVVSIAPGSTQSDASVIAVQMWRQSFGGVNDFGLGSAIAVFLFILVIPVLMLNVRRFRREV
ncbi:MAG TPA: ABC transporter permease subunit [Gaiellaceae bacterium]|nr:ABC transporter permease subunit [Gaiellaceae bacterium]